MSDERRQVDPFNADEPDMIGVSDEIGYTSHAESETTAHKEPDDYDAPSLDDKSPVKRRIFTGHIQRIRPKNNRPGCLIASVVCGVFIIVFLVSFIPSCVDSLVMSFDTLFADESSDTVLIDEGAEEDISNTKDLIQTAVMERATSQEAKAVIAREIDKTFESMCDHTATEYGCDVASFAEAAVDTFGIDDMTAFVTSDTGYVYVDCHAVSVDDAGWAAMDAVTDYLIDIGAYGKAVSSLSSEQLAEVQRIFTDATTNALQQQTQTSSLSVAVKSDGQGWSVDTDDVDMLIDDTYQLWQTGLSDI